MNSCTFGSTRTLALLLIGCFLHQPNATSAQFQQQPPPRTTPQGTGSLVEGRDYLLLKRTRFLDTDGFDRPVEAFSMMFPGGWKTTGGVRWGSIQGCRGDFGSQYVKAASPDGAIRFESFPSRSFGWSNDPQMQQLLQVGAQHGGCAVNQPFDASRYIEGFARMDLGGRASKVRPDEASLQRMRQLDEQANNIARQYGNNSQQTTTMAFGDLTFPDGSEGLIQVGVTNMIMNKPDMMTGGSTMISTTGVFHCVLVRFPAGRQAEGSKLFTLATSSHRVNPIWQQAKSQFLTALGNQEHHDRMVRIRLEGEKARAYAEAQNAARESRMRDWENRQASQDRQHRNFIQAIREVETWKDRSGSGVELSAGYSEAWSRGDGQYILSNKPGFDPRSVFRDQEWQPMQRVP